MMAYSTNDQLDELQELHYRRQLTQELCINKVKHLFPYLMTSCYYSANYNKLVSVSHLTALFIQLFKAPCVDVNYLSIIFTGTLC